MRKNILNAFMLGMASVSTLVTTIAFAEMTGVSHSESDGVVSVPGADDFGGSIGDGAYGGGAIGGDGSASVGDGAFIGGDGGVDSGGLGGDAGIGVGDGGRDRGEGFGQSRVSRYLDQIVNPGEILAIRQVLNLGDDRCGQTLRGLEATIDTGRGAATVALLVNGRPVDRAYLGALSTSRVLLRPDFQNRLCGQIGTLRLRNESYVAIRVRYLSAVLDTRRL